MVLHHHKNLWTTMDKSGLPPLSPVLKCPFPTTKKIYSTPIFSNSPKPSKTLPGKSKISLPIFKRHKKKSETTLPVPFLSASSVLRCENIIARRNNERIWKNLDAAKFLDEAKRGLWNDPKVPSFQVLKRVYESQAFHFRDEEN